MFALHSLSSFTLAFTLLLAGCGYVQFVGALPEEGANIFGGEGNLNIAGSAVDVDGNYYLVGRVDGVVELGAMELRGDTVETAYVVSFSPEGTPRWVQTWSGRFSFATSVDVRNDRVRVTGYVQGTITGALPVTTGGRQELFVFDFSRETGAPMPPPSVFASASGNTQGKTVASAGAFSLLSGHYIGAVDFGLGALPSSPLDADFGFVAAFDAAGDAVWAEAVTGANVILNTAFIRADGSVVAGGAFTNGSIGGRSAEGSDGVVVGFAGDGRMEYELGLGSTGGDQVVSLTAYEEGAVVVGFYQGELNIGGTMLAARGDRDAFVARVGRSGNVMWARSLDGMGGETLRDVRVDAGRIYVAGEFDSELRFADELFTSVGGDDAMVLVFDADGNEVDGEQLGGAGNELVGGFQVQGGRAWVALLLDGETVLDSSGPQNGVMGLRTLSF